ncbi:hypothetical protein [Adhaeretor mobilis]|uniref:Uncharacterized protein n=1 Tax=Adhaeretor mobilis TaxID=1930276 RepID=A0A517MYE2_9BACT|nr:hypothetical protein [Adhaeretor mobilis]QDS99837.1 hypothetical protein HG15A2_31680 [Adhaeretor mobilis]
MKDNKQWSKWLLTLALVPAGLSLGCNEEKVLDVETPAGEVEVTEDTETGEVDVEVDDNE